MNHGIVLLVVLATFRTLDYHGCNGQVSIPITPLPPPPPCPPPPPDIVRFRFPPPPLLKPPPRPPPTHSSSDPYNCCFDPYHCCDHDDDSHSGIDIWLVVLVAAILLVLMIIFIFFLWGFKNFVAFIGVGLQNLVQAINENLVKSVNGVTGAINTNLGLNGAINKTLTNIDTTLGRIDGRIEAISVPIVEISNRVVNVCPQCNMYLIVPPCECGRSTCGCGGSLCSPCRCDGSA